MSSFDPNDTSGHEPRLRTRFSQHSANQPDPAQPDPDEDPLHPHHPALVAAALPPHEDSFASPEPTRRRKRLTLRSAFVLFIVLAVLAFVGVLVGRHWLRSATAASLPQIDGTLVVSGLTSAVTVQRDAHGVPHIHANSLDDLVFAQGFIVAGDRLWQMDMLRRHAAGELAEILGSGLIPHDKLQRTLQVRAAADRAVTQLPPDQLRLLEAYARGVNASIAQQSAHFPIEFRILGYKPEPWTPRDSILVSLAMFQDLTDGFPAKLAREALSNQLNANGARDLVQDLYPVGSWRDHPPASPTPDLTLPGPPLPDVPLDESQSKLEIPTTPRSPFIPPSAMNGSIQPLPQDCADCRPGSNNWVVSGAHTASGKPLLSNDMHLTHSLPGIWYEADLEAPNPTSTEPLHVAGVTIPGLPLIVVGHNGHISWGFTNLGADVQDLYVETTRGSGSSTEFQSTDGSWQPVLHLPELIRVKHGVNVTLNVTATRHGDAVTPILTPLLKNETRPIALRWTLYDPSVIQLPVLDIASAHDWPSFLAAFAKFGGPAQNVVYADDQGHIGYHAAGRIPMRGPARNQAAAAASTLPDDVATPVLPNPSTSTPVISANPNPLDQTTVKAPPAPSTTLLSGPLSGVPITPSPAHEWSGYIPFDQLPQVYDPPGGVIATANARVTPDDFPYPITLNWGAPYRNERIWKLLAHKNNLTAAEMLAIQTDIYSDFDHVLAQRLAYAIDHSPKVIGQAGRATRLHLAADLLRNWDGRLMTDSSPAAIVTSVHAVLWPMLLTPHLKQGSDPALLYQWFSKDYALEQILMHTPPRWLPKGYTNWDDFLADVVVEALQHAKAPADLAKWRYGSIHELDIEHPIFAEAPLLARLLGRPTGTGIQPQSGDGTTVKQVGRTFGPSERYTADLADLDHSTLNIVLGQSGNPASPWFLDQFPAWYHGTTFPMPYSPPAVTQSTTHTLTLIPQ